MDGMSESPVPEFTLRQSMSLFSPGGSCAYNWWVAKLVVSRWWQARMHQLKKVN